MCGLWYKITVENQTLISNNPRLRNLNLFIQKPWKVIKNTQMKGEILYKLV
jgi:hypothetical protein